MPELPEVEMIVKDLRSKIVGRRILGVQTDWPKYFRLPSSEAGFRACITQQSHYGVDRRSKNVLISLTGDYLLLIHQKISGRLLVGNWERKSESQAGSTPHSLWQPVSPLRGSPVPQGRFIHLLFDLDDGRQLGLSDLRKFAKALCGKREVILNRPEIRQLGPEPLDPQFTLARFKQLFAGRKGRIKQMLMNPKFIAGIGNIYSDEILYAAGIHPLSRLTTFQEPQLKALYRSIKTVLKKAVRMRGTGIVGGSAPARADQGYDKVRMVYQRRECPRGHEIQRIKIGGRSARFCPVEQKLF
jgi:formamidopyrimidine-DNA glycosylase